MLRPLRERLVVAGIMMGVVLGAIESTVVTTAMPTIIQSLGGIAHYSWVFTAYMVAYTVSGPIWGKLSDLYGRKPFYLLGIGLFLLGSALAGQSHSMGALIFWRIVQGLGAGALMPLGMIVLGELFTLQERARMQALFSSVWGGASIVGPLVGGLITEHWSWRWVFYINVPFGILAGALVGLALPRLYAGPARGGVDRLGIALFTTMITVLMIWLTVAGKDIAWSSPPSLLCAATIAVLLPAFLWQERRAHDPLIPLPLFRVPMFLAATANFMLVGMALFGLQAYLPLFVQGVRGGTATEAGGALTPLLFGWVTSSTIASRLVLRVGYRATTAMGTAFLLFGAVGILVLSAGAPQWIVLLAAGLTGCAGGFCVAPMTIGVQSMVPRERLGIATSATMFFRFIGGAVGVAAMGAFVARAVGHVPSGIALTDPTLRPLLAKGLHEAFVFAAALGVLALLTTALVPAGRPHELHGTGRRAG